jgi:hypothetical protein
MTRLDPRRACWTRRPRPAQCTSVIAVSELGEAVQDAADAGRLPCAIAFSIAGRFGVSPHAVREAADDVGVRVSLCQLGLFGYDAFGERRAAPALPLVPEELRAGLAAAAVDGRLSCAAAWRLADEGGLPRFLVGSVAETVGVRISRCQLGCFD